jgi:hypothetical protein
MGDKGDGRHTRSTSRTRRSPLEKRTAADACVILLTGAWSDSDTDDGEEEAEAIAEVEVEQADTSVERASHAMRDTTTSSSSSPGLSRGTLSSWTMRTALSSASMTPYNCKCISLTTKTPIPEPAIRKISSDECTGRSSKQLINTPVCNTTREHQQSNGRERARESKRESVCVCVC